jgi:hypothetical protein
VIADIGFCSIGGKTGREAAVPDRAGRILRSVVGGKLWPMCKLQGKQFLTAYFGIINCMYFQIMWINDQVIATSVGHFAAWMFGVHHKDPSLGSCMSRVHEGTVCGALIDYDFAVDVKHGIIERTSSIPFMSLDLLK